MGQERGIRWKNQDKDYLSSDRRHDREGGSMDPNTMSPGMTRWEPRTKAYADAKSGW